MTARIQHPSLTAFLIGILIPFLWLSGTFALEVVDIIDLLDAGIGEEVILQQIAADGSTFALDTDDLLDLKDAGASDDLILALIATEGERGHSRNEEYRESYDIDSSYHAYRPASVSIYYDPFGYYWYPWPYYFAYYAPFSCFDFGFYYGAHIHWGWAYWGPRYTYYAYDCGFHYPPYRSHSRGLWSRQNGRTRTHYVVSPKTPRGQYARSTRKGGRDTDRWTRTRQKQPRATTPQKTDRWTRTKRPRTGSGTLPRYNKQPRQHGSRPARTPSRSRYIAPKIDRSKPATRAPRAPSPRPSRGKTSSPKPQPKNDSKPASSSKKS